MQPVGFKMNADHQTTSEPVKVPVQTQQSAIYQLVEKIDERASNLAADVLRKYSYTAQPKMASAAPTVNVQHHHYHNHYHDSLWLWPSMPAPARSPDTNIHSSSSKSDKEAEKKRKEDEAAAMLCVVVGVVAVAAIGVFSLAIGSAVSRLKNAMHELAEVKEQRDKLRAESKIAAKTDPKAYRTEFHLVESGLTLSSLSREIWANRKLSAITDVALRGGVLVGSAVALADCLAGSGARAARMALGTAVVFGSAMLFKWGYESVSKDSERAAIKIQAEHASLKRVVAEQEKAKVEPA